MPYYDVLGTQGEGKVNGYISKAQNGIHGRRKSKQTTNDSAHLSQLGKIANLREPESIITKHFQGPDVFFSSSGFH